MTGIKETGRWNYKSRAPSLVGRRFGRLVVVQQAASVGQGFARWHCRCDCGRPAIVLAQCLRQGQTKSCGCLRAEKNRVNGKRFRGHTPAVLAKCAAGARAAAERQRAAERAAFDLATFWVSP